MPNLPAQQAQIVPYGRGAKPHFCLLFINPTCMAFYMGNGKPKLDK